MASAGEIVTFHVIFLDGLNARIAVADPTIEVFTFNSDGDRVDLVAAGTEMAEVGGDPRRYAYLYTIPLDYNYDSRIYAVMQGTEPASGFPMIVEDHTDVYEQGSAFGGGSGRRMNAKFIK